jgi:hypothetical protein
VAVLVSCQAHLYHKYEVLLEVNCPIQVDVQFFEPGVCIFYL